MEIDCNSVPPTLQCRITLRSSLLVSLAGGGEVCLKLVLALFLTTKDLGVGSISSVDTDPPEFRTGVEPRTGLSWCTGVVGRHIDI